MSIVWPCSGVMRRGRSCRGRAVTFFASPKKVTKERRPCWLRPSASLRATCVATLAGCAAELAAFTSFSTLEQLRRVRSRSSCCRTRHSCHPAIAAPQAHPEGTWGDDRAIASLGPRKNTKQGQGCAAALLTPVPSVCAEERSGWRIRARDCLSEASLSETPPAASTAGCPVAKRRGRRQWGRLSFAYFSLARQRKVGAPPGAHPGSCLRKGTRTTQQTNIGAGP